MHHWITKTSENIKRGKSSKGMNVRGNRKGKVQRSKEGLDHVGLYRSEKGLHFMFDRKSLETLRHDLT